MSEFNFVSSGSKMEEISEEAKVECMYRKWDEFLSSSYPHNVKRKRSRQ